MRRQLSSSQMEVSKLKTLCLSPPRPHVVTVQWLLDSFNRGSLLPESDYLHPDCLPPAPAAVSVPAPRASTSRPSAGPPVASPSTPLHKRAEEEDLLSQYMDDDPTVSKYCLLTDFLRIFIIYAFV